MSWECGQRAIEEPPSHVSWSSSLPRGVWDQVSPRDRDHLPCWGATIDARSRVYCKSVSSLRTTCICLLNCDGFFNSCQTTFHMWTNGYLRKMTAFSITYTRQQGREALSCLVLYQLSTWSWYCCSENLSFSVLKSSWLASTKRKYLRKVQETNYWGTICTEL